MYTLPTDVDRNYNNVILKITYLVCREWRTRNHKEVFTMLEVEARNITGEFHSVEEVAKFLKNPNCKKSLANGIFYDISQNCHDPKIITLLVKYAKALRRNNQAFVCLTHHALESFRAEAQYSPFGDFHFYEPEEKENSLQAMELLLDLLIEKGHFTREPNHGITKDFLLKLLKSLYHHRNRLDISKVDEFLKKTAEALIVGRYLDDGVKRSYEQPTHPFIKVAPRLLNEEHRNRLEVRKEDLGQEGPDSTGGCLGKALVNLILHFYWKEE